MHTPTPYLFKFIDASKDDETGAYVAEQIKMVIEELGPEKCIGIVTDRASINLKAWKLLQITYPWLQVEGCKAHAGNLFLTDIFTSVDYEEYVAKSSKIVCFFRYFLRFLLL